MLSARSWLGSSSRAYSRPEVGSTSRTTPWPVSPASNLLSEENAKTLPPISGPGCQPSTVHNREPLQLLVASHLPLGLKPTRPCEGSSFSRLPLGNCQTFAL